MLKLSPELIYQRRRSLLLHLAEGFMRALFNQPRHGPNARGNADGHQKKQLGL
jgi:hypothetical protein